MTVIGFYDRVRVFFAPLETRSGHGAENEQPVPCRGEKKKINNPPRLQNSAIRGTALTVEQTMIADSVIRQDILQCGNTANG